MDEIKIRKIDNGYIVGTDDNISAFEDSEDDREHCDMISRILYHILEEIGEYGSKHDKYRVRIIISEDGKNVDS